MRRWGHPKNRIWTIQFGVEKSVNLMSCLRPRAPRRLPPHSHRFLEELAVFPKTCLVSLQFVCASRPPLLYLNAPDLLALSCLPLSPRPALPLLSHQNVLRVAEKLYPQRRQGDRRTGARPHFPQWSRMCRPFAAPAQSMHAFVPAHTPHASAAGSMYRLIT